METINIKDPHSNQDIHLKVNAEEHNQQQAWRIKFEDGKNLLIGLDQHGIWQQLDGNELDSGFVNNIGRAIEAQQNYSS